MAGDPRGARTRAHRALDLVAPETPIAVSALTELGEDDAAEGRFAEAANYYASAIDAATGAAFTDVAIAALFRRRAGALARAGRHPQALQDLERASERFARGGDMKSSVRVRVEKATVAQEGGDLATAERIALGARQQAEGIGDHLALSDLDLLSSAAAVQRGHLDTALAFARDARAEALVAVAPHLYTAATLAIAELAERTGDRVGAYAALATGWATLRDLLGAELAEATFEPRLRDVETRWGAAEFASVRAEYETSRRAAIASGQGLNPLPGIESPSPPGRGFIKG
jgi:tetratricopeptide (TPR) repeat protein